MMSPFRPLLPAAIVFATGALTAAPALGQTYGYQNYAYPDGGYPAYNYQGVANPDPSYPQAGQDQGYGQNGYGAPPAYGQPYQPQQAAPAYGDGQQGYAEPQPQAAPVQKPAAVAAALPGDFVQRANQPALPTALKGGSKQPSPEVARLQILLARSHVSPGVIDGLSGGNLSKAVSALENMNGMPSTGRMSPAVDQILAAVGEKPVFTSYVISASDAAGPFTPVIPKDYAELAQLPRLGYKSIVEMLGEKFHMDEGFLRRLNPGARFAAGETITVADVGPPARTKVYHLVADRDARQLLGYDQAWNLVVAYPATIGSTDMPSPSGMHNVKAIAVDPVYWYRPKVNFQQGKNDKPLKIPPGPNNPVGAVWIGLDKPTYGIHGTPEPSRIDKTNSHGCLRLTNWDALELAHLVRPGVDVDFVDPSATTASIPSASRTEANLAAPQPQQPMPPAIQ